MAMQRMLTQGEIPNSDTIIASVPAVDGKGLCTAIETNEGESWLKSGRLVCWQDSEGDVVLSFWNRSSTINSLTLQACLCISAISTFHNVCMHDFCLRQPKYGILQLN